MIQPFKYKERAALNSLTGIKSSLPRLKSVVSLCYLLYLANGKKPTVSYSQENGTLYPEFTSYIKSYLEDDTIEGIIKENPLLTSQIESLYVGITLMFGLGKIAFVNDSFVMTKERTGLTRYPKKIDFASNMILLDVIFQGVIDNEKKVFLKSWLKNEALNTDLELRILVFLNICIENNLFKLRKGDDDLFFQTEGIYLALQNDKEVSLESDEKVGPARILNSMLREGLVPWLSIKKSIVSLNSDCDFNSDFYAKILSTSLDIRDIKVDRIENSSGDKKSIERDPSSSPLQKIFYGTPGSGKSFIIRKLYEMKFENGKYVEDEEKKKRVIRTTFHPDTDYATFVGCYKPKTYGNSEEKKISYEFVPQAFTNAYVKAWNDPQNQYTLIIEEINRGNCAQIFGDLFQLLDRNKEGISDYPIDADNDLREYLEGNLPKDSDGIKDGKLCLPANLNIVASMNTSDQSLFPMDSAFKRRWAWEYVPIDYANEESGKFTITIGNLVYQWHAFLRIINDKIKKVTSSEDKQMGNFFIKQSVDVKEFKDKVMFYLWSEIGKDNYQTNDALFHCYRPGTKDKIEFSFNELYASDSIQKLQDFMDILGEDAQSKNYLWTVEEKGAATSNDEEPIGSEDEFSR